MKRIFTLALSILTVSNLFATAEFFVRINNNGNYTVSLNNQTITSTSNVFRFFDLYNGTYSLNVFENGLNGRLVFNQPVVINDGYRTVAELDRFYGLKLIDKIPFVQNSWYVDVLQSIQYPPICTAPVPKPFPSKPSCNNGGGYGHYNGGWSSGCGNNYPYNNYPPAGHPNSYPNTYPGGNYGYGNLMNDASMQMLIQTMKNVTFEDKMIAVAKTALNDRILKTAQVHQLLQQFVFEQNKLEVAKFCYNKTIDKNNYYTLYNDFIFSNYSTQLDKYINSK